MRIKSCIAHKIKFLVHIYVNFFFKLSGDPFSLTNCVELASLKIVEVSQYLPVHAKLTKLYVILTSYNIRMHRNFIPK